MLLTLLYKFVVFGGTGSGASQSGGLVADFTRFKCYNRYLAEYLINDTTNKTSNKLASGTQELHFPYIYVETSWFPYI